MHFRAIKHSKAPSEDPDPVIASKRLQLDGNDSRYEANLETSDHMSNLTLGDNACDAEREILGVRGAEIPGLTVLASKADNQRRGTIVSRTPGRFQEAVDCTRVCSHSSDTSSATSRHSHLTESNRRSLTSSFAPIDNVLTSSSFVTVQDSHTASTRTRNPFLPISIPFQAANDMAPFAYHRALRKRIRDDELETGHKYDIKAYTPMFVHDCLMMPGSMSNIRGKGSAEDVVRRMTPALLPGFHAHVHELTHAPILLQSSKPGDYVQGMLIFGQSKEVRHKVHEHYRPFHKRIKIEIELDTVHPVPSHVRTYPGERWELRRRSVWAHAWIWKNAHSGDACFPSLGMKGGWHFDDYLAGKYTPKQSLRIEPAGWIEDDNETIVTEGGNAGEPQKDGWQPAEVHFSEAWEACSGGDGAVPFDDDAWNQLPSCEDGDEGDHDDPETDRPAVNRFW